MVYWSRFFIAIATGIGSVIALNGIVDSDSASFIYPSVAILVYGATVVYYRSVARFGEAELKSKNKVITLGIGTYIFAWLASLTLAYTLLVPH
jgi:hypothetical protein